MLSHSPLEAPHDDASVPAQASRPWLSDSSDPSKPYHATAEWGKRRMTLQELTRAFDAFNEAEERVALRFAGSEDCDRKLAEPLSEVKTVFLDLDGLRPLSGCPTFSPAPQRNNVSHITQVNLDTNASGRNELSYIIRTGDMISGSNASDTHQHPGIEFDRRVDEDTLKPSQKPRRSLLAASPSAIPSQYPLKFEDERPPSRLGFIGDRNTDEYGEEDGEDTL